MPETRAPRLATPGRTEHDSDERDPRVLQLPALEGLGFRDARRVDRILQRLLGALVLLVASGIVASTFVPMDSVVQASGGIEPTSVTPSYAPIAGEVAQVLVRAGDTVTKGQALVRLNATTLAEDAAVLDAQYEGAVAALAVARKAVTVKRQLASIAFDQADARLRSAKATLRDQLTNYGLTMAQAESLYRKDAHVGAGLALGKFKAEEAAWGEAQLQRDDSTAAEGDIAARHAQVEQLEKQREAARRRVTSATIMANASGVVAAQETDTLAGRYVAVGARLIDVVQPNAWKAVAEVSERDAATISPGDPVTLHLPALDGLYSGDLHGKVSEIGARANQRDAAGTGSAKYQLVAALDVDAMPINATRRLRPGYSAQLRITTARTSLFRVLTRSLGIAP